MSKTETMKVTVTVEIPENVYKLLKEFSAFSGVPLEETLKDQLESDVRGLWHSEVFFNWTESAITKAGCADYFSLNQGEAK